ncbi:MAG: disulfide bond formation protein DsbA [Polynucleobacter sp. 32-46-5]|nr:MAG: disulfide bond formation protein DsbA [Polynucleobacter sp. 32-46-5]
MKPTIKIDFVSDVACPWCAVGLGNLNNAIEHLTEKYGLTEEQVKANQTQIRERALEAGFQFHPDGRKRVYNTFDAHRLLHWAGVDFGLEMQAHLKTELLKTYFCLAVNLDDQQNLLNAVTSAGLDSDKAKQVLESGLYANEVREEEAQYTGAGIHSVPSIILNDQYLVQGAQAPESFINAFEQLI